MADRIVISTDWLNRCMTEIKQVQNALNEAKSRLGQVDLSYEAGGHKSISFRNINLKCGARISGDDVTEVVRSISRGMNTSGADIRKLISGISASIDMFNDIENKAVGLMNGVTEPSDSNVYSETAAGFDWASFFDKSSSIITEIRKRLAEEQKRWEEARKAAKERRDKLIEEANARDIFEDNYADQNILYGGQQHGPRDDRASYDDFSDIIYRNTGKRLTGSDLTKYLNRVNSEGCGYMAMVNVILKRYQGRAADFERDFGIPMYKNGDFNYNELMIDIYSSTDNHNAGLTGDKIDKKEDWNFGNKFFGYDMYTDSDGFGTDKVSFEYRLEKYLNDHGVNGNVTVYDRGRVTVENYHEFAENGPVVISVGRPFTMRDADGNVYNTWNDAGHSMIITGVENGRFVVSSWGDKYLIDPNDNFGYMNFRQLT